MRFTLHWGARQNAASHLHWIEPPSILRQNPWDFSAFFPCWWMYSLFTPPVMGESLCLRTSRTCLAGSHRRIHVRWQGVRVFTVIDEGTQLHSPISLYVRTAPSRSSRPTESTQYNGTRRPSFNDPTLIGNLITPISLQSLSTKLASSMALCLPK